MEKQNKKKLIGWIASGISAIFANLWAFWGINENFHEGWYFRDFWNNIFMMFGQYLLLPIGFMLLSVVSIKWKKAGSVSHFILAIGAFVLFGKMNAGFLFVVLPFIGLAVLYWFGNIEKKKMAYILVLALPLLQILGIGTFHAVKVANRFNDDNFEMRSIKGNGIELLWAPKGPGWPDVGTTWYDAKKICAFLSEDGKTLCDKEQNIWRLPTVDEAVRSMVYHGNNAGGVWKEDIKKAEYNNQPDKESPLWNMYLKTIYWWTSTEVNEKNAYIVVYNGGVWPRWKNLKADYLNFRAIKKIN
jgi:hypothetical protein